MGVRIEHPFGCSPERSGQHAKACSKDIIVYGVGLHGLKNPVKPLFLGNSGTTMRLLSGILAGQDFETILTGDKSLSVRPMRRIVEPLRKMGAVIEGSRGHLSVPYCRSELYPPLRIKGGKLKAINYKSKIPSAQVKSAILLAGLYADGITSVTEPVKTRDHTERMLRQFGVRRKVKGLRCEVKGPAKLRPPGTIRIPGDISSAAFFIVAGLILPNSEITVKNVGLNPTRTGILGILKKMGANLTILTRLDLSDYEPVGDIVVRSSRLKGVRISPKDVVQAIDEIPILMVAACFAKGRTIIEGIGELHVKETDRVHSMVTNLRKMGAEIEVKSEKLKVKGGRLLHGAKVSSFGDHRTAMSMLIAGLAAKGKIELDDTSCINKSFPNFIELTKKLFSDRIFSKRGTK